MIITIDTEKRELTPSAGDSAVAHPLYSREASEVISREWLRIGWDLGHWCTFTWMGRQLLQLPSDVLRLQEALFRLRPDVIVETGVYDGGSSLLFATVCRMIGHGRVIAIESSVREGVREALDAAGVSLIEGDSSSPETAAEVRRLIPAGVVVFVFLDSDHSRSHVARELDLYAPLVSPGSWIVAADGIMADLADVPHGDPSWEHDNPAAAVRDFLSTHAEFAIECEETLTYFRNGWLRRL